MKFQPIFGRVGLRRVAYVGCDLVRQWLQACFGESAECRRCTFLSLLGGGMDLVECIGPVGFTVVVPLEILRC